jgi:hypothetical protein
MRAELQQKIIKENQRRLAIEVRAVAPSWDYITCAFAFRLKSRSWNKRNLS